jgi:hypothetical protein
LRQSTSVTNILRHSRFDHKQPAQLKIRSQTSCAIQNSITNILRNSRSTHKHLAQLKIRSQTFCAIQDSIINILRHSKFDHKHPAQLQIGRVRLVLKRIVRPFEYVKEFAKRWQKNRRPRQGFFLWRWTKAAAVGIYNSMYATGGFLSDLFGITRPR